MNRQAARPIDNTRSSLELWTAIPLRLIVGYGFIAHGYAKIARGPVYFIDTLNALGVPWPGGMGWATILLVVVREWFDQQLINVMLNVGPCSEGVRTLGRNTYNRRER